ncbi:MAG: nucleotidyltransferase domain-containing protein [Clostridia bacterium]|nr:nucleotidyltransferase domain-containing protein [Clostridia bacterium]
MYSGIIKAAVEHGALKIILFGSRAKGTDTEHSDIDICIVAKTTNKRRLAATISAEIDCDIPVDVLVYTPDEWEDCISDETSFATKILKEGTVLYG